jgi:hypothetical protein
MRNYTAHTRTQTENTWKYMNTWVEKKPELIYRKLQNKIKIICEKQKKVCNYPSYKRKTQQKKKHYSRIINTTKTHFIQEIQFAKQRIEIQFTL